MKDRILIFLYEVQCVLKDFAVVFCALFGIKIKTFTRVDWVDNVAYSYPFISAYILYCEV